MKRAKRKAVLRSKGPPRYAMAPLVRRGEDFQVLHAAHRAQLAKAMADLAAEKLRAVAQVVGIVLDVGTPIREVPAPVKQAISAADAALLNQIEVLEMFATAPEPGPVSLADLTNLGTALACRRAPKVQVRVKVPRGLPPAAANPADLVEVIFALVNNGCRAVAGKTDGTVSVTATAQAKGITLTVDDNGPGFASGMKRHLFDPLVTTRRDGDHLGIGLAVSRHLAQRNGGDLRAETSSAGGARCVLVLPRWDALSVGSRRAIR